ncbi:MAG: hypothetical protein NVSMB31_14660 [Vulcanimicrobiaceae bacterium]
MRMQIGVLLLSLGFAGVCGGPLDAAESKSGMPVASEIPFVHAIQRDLLKRFPKASDAEKAGYMRYTGEDSTGAISFTNFHWLSRDPQHPAQLWYDTKGNLLGADFSVPADGHPQAPVAKWGILQKRWTEFPPHIHFISQSPDGKIALGDMSVRDYLRFGGNLKAPTLDPFIKAGIVKAPAKARAVFLAPHIWDLIVWVKANPDGAFAEKNPLVKP